MIVFFAPGGRVGNLLFQLAYLESIRRPRERIFTTKLFGVHEAFSALGRYRNTDFRPVTQLIDKFLVPWLGTFLKLSRLASTHIEKGGVLLKTKGLLPLTYVEGYFQRPIPGPLRFQIPEDAFVRARRLVAAVEPGRIPVFVHVRRADYGNYVVEDGVRPLLGEPYYRAGMAKLAEFGSPLHFFFLGDSPGWCRVTFTDKEPRTVSDLSPVEDLALMSLCAGGVVSNSTFAWWGGAFCQKTVPVVAPMYWLGWPAKRWITRGIETPWMTYLDGEWGDQP